MPNTSPTTQRAATPFHWPVSAQLFLPESWVADAERRKRTHVPADMGEQTKPAIALSLLDRARAWGVPIQAVVVDAGYGDNPNFLTGLMSARCPTSVRWKAPLGCACPRKCRQPRKQTPTYGGRGQPRKPRPAPLYSVKALIEAQPASRLADDRAGGRAPKARCGRRCWRCASTGPPARHATAPATAASTPARGLAARRAPRACSPASQRPPTDWIGATARHCEAGSRGGARSPGDQVLVQLAAPRHLAWSDWSRWPTPAGSSSSFTKMPSRNVAWTTSRDDAGTACTGISPWSCSPTVSWRCNACSCLCRREEVFPPLSHT